MVSKYEFLVQLHQLLKPKVYLEIGVQSGASMSCADPSTFCIGIDPDWSNFRGGVGHAGLRLEKCAATSDDYFDTQPHNLHLPINLAFIDGMHLAEYALRDFYNCEQRMAPGGVIVLDDVLPYNQAIASRTQPPGDWTGDVWRVYDILSHNSDLTLRLVDVSPTGLLLVTGMVGGGELPPIQLSEPPLWGLDPVVPDYILYREDAYQPHVALTMLTAELGL